jgi:PilZ domain
MVLETQKSQPEPAVNGIVTRKSERRIRPRAALQWVVHVSRAGGLHPVSGKTSNVSSQGFYCLVQEPLESGQRVECTLVIPIPKSGKPDAVVWLKCRARLLRVEAVAGDNPFGIAFLIEEYCLVHLNPVQIKPAAHSMVID